MDQPSYDNEFRRKSVTSNKNVFDKKMTFGFKDGKVKIKQK